MEDLRSTKTGDDLSEHRINGVDAGDFNMAEGDGTQEVTANANLAPEVHPAAVDGTQADLNMVIDTVEVTTESRFDNVTEDARSSMTQTQDFASPQSPGPARRERFEDNEKTPTQSAITSRPLTDGLSPDSGSNNGPESSATHVQETGAFTGSRIVAHSPQLEALPVQMANNEQGSAARIYINTKVTPVLLEGMKWVAKNEPEKPLKWLSEFLAKRSADIEGM